MQEIPHDVKMQMEAHLEEVKKVKSKDKGLNFDDEVDAEDAIAQEEERQTKVKIIGEKRKAQVNHCFAPRTTPGSQPSLKSVFQSKEAIHEVNMRIARWLADARIPFNAIQSPFFKEVLDGIAGIGPGYKGPSYYELRVHLLSDLKKECQLLVDSYRNGWKQTGCTLMADGWTDRRQRTLINFLVYCPIGMCFIRSVDASDMVKTAASLFNLFVEVIDWVGPNNVVHVVTDNAANYVAAGKLIHEKYEHIFWSPCAAHCLNLILKDIGSMPHIQSLASRASKVTVFVYNHLVFLSWLRKRPGWKEIVRPGPTRFATVFLTLKSIYEHKADLQALVVDTHFTGNKLSKSANGRAVSEIVLDKKFWDNCFTMCKLVGPLMRLLRIVDSDEKPSLGYVYEGMQRAKIAIKEMFKNKKTSYQPYTEIIKARWDKHLKKSLHAAAYHFNPAFSFNDKFIQKHQIMRAVLDLFDIKSLCSDPIKAMGELKLYEDRKESFDRPTAVKAAIELQPSDWWKYFGGSAPILQKMAIRILSQTSSSSGCERNWSIFEQIHTKRRNRLEHQRLNDLVYVTYNLRLKTRLQQKKKTYDPIDYESINLVDFWVTEEVEEPELSTDLQELNQLFDENFMPSYDVGPSCDVGDDIDPPFMPHAQFSDSTNDGEEQCDDHDIQALNEAFDE